MLGVGFFLQTKFDFLTEIFLTTYFYQPNGIVVLSSNLKKNILPVIIIHKVLRV